MSPLTAIHFWNDNPPTKSAESMPEQCPTAFSTSVAVAKANDFQ